MQNYATVEQPKSLDQLIIEDVLTPYGVDTGHVSKESLQAFRRGTGFINVWFLFGGESSPQIGYAMITRLDGGVPFSRLRRRWPYPGKHRWWYIVGDVATDAPIMEDCPALYVEQALSAGNLSGEPAARWLKQWHEASFREWCAAFCLWPLRTTPFMVASYLHSLWFDDATPEMVRLARRTISEMHASMGLPDPTVDITCPVGCSVTASPLLADRQRIIDQVHERGTSTVPALVS